MGSRILRHKSTDRAARAQPQTRKLSQRLPNARARRPRATLAWRTRRPSPRSRAATAVRWAQTRTTIERRQVGERDAPHPGRSEPAEQRGDHRARHAVGCALPRRSRPADLENAGGVRDESTEPDAPTTTLGDQRDRARRRRGEPDRAVLRVRPRPLVVVQIANRDRRRAHPPCNLSPPGATTQMSGSPTSTSPSAGDTGVSETVSFAPRADSITGRLRGAPRRSARARPRARTADRPATAACRR